jgi:hypothetical protein
MEFCADEAVLDRVLSEDPILAALAELFPHPPNPLLWNERCNSA